MKRIHINKEETVERVVRIIKEYSMMTIGMLLYSFGWMACIVPAGGVGGGATGLSIILTSWINSAGVFAIEVGTMVLIINGVLLIAAGFIVGWNFGIKTLFCIAMLSLSMNFWGKVLPEEQIFDIENILLIILGAIFAGAGVAICFNQGGSTGGTDIASTIINKYRNIPYSKIVICSDFVIISSSLLFGRTIEAVIYGFLFTATFGYVVDMMMSGNHQSSQIFIIAQDYQLMANTIMQSAKRGVTILDSQGGYTGNPSKIVMVVCRKRETTTILNLVKRVDPQAFITVGPVMGAYGLGFEELRKL